MAIHTDNAVQGSQGIAKEIDSASISVLLDLTQENQYQYPVQSTIRELVSNAVDSTTEKLRALQILSGEKQVSDFFVEKEGDLYEASRFKPEYYDPVHLSPGNSVRIELEQRGPEHQRDILRVLDNGVGLWGERLKGFFQVGYSNKRLDSQTLGRFGLGAKSPLSMDVASFRVQTTYNGMRTAFDIYNRKIIPVYGKWNEQEEARESFTFSDGTKVYFDRVTEPNGLTVEVEVKKAWRQDVVQAIKSQLLYFSTVVFFIKTEYSDQFVQQQFLAEVQYEDDYIILSNNNQYSQPHLVLDNGNSKVCYNRVDWAQLELENKQGNIGLKFKAEEVDIVPSREYVKWGSKTREIVLKRFEQAQQIATSLVEKELKETDPLRWLQKASTIFSSLGSNTVLGKLSRIVPKDAITPKFPGSDIKFQGPEQLLMGLKLRAVGEKDQYEYEYAPKKWEVSRLDVTSWAQVAFDAFYVTRGSASKAKDVQLSRQHNGRFTLLSIPDEPEAFDPSKAGTDANLDNLRIAHAAKLSLHKKSLEVIDWLLTSALAKDYDTVIVTEATEQEVTAVDAAVAQRAAEEELTPAQLRKLQGKVFLKYYTHYRGNCGLKSLEPTLGEMQAWTEPIIYGSLENRTQMQFIAQMIAKQTGGYDGYSTVQFNHKILLLQVSQDVAKKLPKHAVHCDNFLYQVTPTTLSLNPLLRPWYTSLKVSDYLKQVPFLRNYGIFNAEINQLYQELTAYVSNNMPYDYWSGDKQTLYENLLDATEQMATFEQFVKDHSSDTEAIAEKSQELFGAPNVTDSKVWEVDIQQKLEKLQLYCQPLLPLFNQINILTTSYPSWTPELEQEIRQLCLFKGVQID